MFHEHPPIDPWPHPACLPEEELLKQCTIGRGRTSGPGGQHRNKVETAVLITHEPTGLSGFAGERRSQIENKQVALKRLRHTLAVEVRVGVPAGQVGSVLWRSRVRKGRISVNPEHRDFPALLAEAMDVLAEAAWDPKKAALRLEVTSTQLVRLIGDHPPALLKVNAERSGRGQRELRA